jgi:hypothetical protein
MLRNSIAGNLAGVSVRVRHDLTQQIGPCRTRSFSKARRLAAGDDRPGGLSHIALHDYSTDNSTHPGKVAGRLFRKTIRRVFGNGRLVASA